MPCCRSCATAQMVGLAPRTYDWRPYYTRPLMPPPPVAGMGRRAIVGLEVPPEFEGGRQEGGLARRDPDGPHVEATRRVVDDEEEGPGQSCALELFAGLLLGIVTGGGIVWLVMRP